MAGGGPAWTSLATATDIPGLPEKRIPGQPNSYAEMMTMRGQQGDIAREAQNTAAVKREQQESGAKVVAEVEEEPSEEYKKEREEMKKSWPSQYAFEEAMKKARQ